MFNKILSMCGKGFIAVILAALVLAAAYGISWICTCGVIKLITMCFGWTFSWGMATGVWLIMCLARSVFNHTTVKK
jgi:hypothetical protein